MQTSSIDIESLHPTTRYATEVVSGLRISCEYEWKACNRHLKDLQRQGTDEFPYFFDESRANRIFDWFEKCCRHVKGVYSGQLIGLLIFQKFDLGCIFGWVHKENGRRRFKKSYSKISRGNAKSAIMSGIALYGMCSDCYYPPENAKDKVYESSPQIECTAYDKDQAKIVWNDAREMGLKSPDICKRLNIKETYIKHKTRGGHCRPLSKDTRNKDGLSPCIAVVDEYHCNKTSAIHDIVFSSFGKRAQNLMCIITTAGQDAENNPCKIEEDICKQILDERFENETYFVIIRELDKNDDPHDQKNWCKSNPMLQESNEYTEILRAQILEEYKIAYGSGDPSKIREFLTKRCNLWQSDSENKYMSGNMDKWKALAVSREEFLSITRSRECYTGVDLSKRIDLSGVGYVFPLDDGKYAICAYGFMPSEGVKRHENSDRVPYAHWAKEGWCTITEGEVTDYDYILSHAHDFEFDNQWKIVEWDLDPANATQFSNNLQKEGYTVVDIRQGTLTLSEPTKDFRELILQNKIIHDGSPLTTWCLSNALEITDDKGNIKLSKKHKDDSQRIDLIAAIINAFTRARIAAPQNIYETRGIRVL